VKLKEGDWVMQNGANSAVRFFWVFLFQDVLIMV
jgi:hypothetical protein